MRVSLSTLLLFCTLSCATQAPSKPSDTTGPGPGSTVSQEDARWTPGPGADAALAALWKGEPFSLPAAELAKASGGPVARFAELEPLLSDLRVRYDDKGRGTQHIHTVYRILKDDEDLLVQRVGWAAWHEKKPVIRTRVVGPDGDEKWLDPATIVEGSQVSSSDMLTDARVLRAPLPGAKVGAVVESLVVIEDSEPSFGPAASGRFETWQYALRRARLTLEYPPSLPLVAVVTGEGTLARSTRDGLEVLSLDLTPSPFPLFTLARLDVPVKLPRVEWSTAKSWKPVASGYASWVNAALSTPIDISTLSPRVASRPTRTEKVQETLAWLRERARYMALHLGAGALKPTAPGEVLKRGYGDCKDLSVSMVSALGQLGIEARVALIQAGGVPTNEQVPGLSGFDHAIVYVPPAKGEPAVWVDATAEGFPVGTLPPSLLDRKALVIAPDTEGLTALPTRAGTTSKVMEEIVIRQAEFGEASATLTRAFEGPIAGWMRSRFAKADARELEQALRPSNQLLVGDDPLVVKFENAEPSLSAPRFVGTAERISAVDTGGLTATVTLAGPVVGSFADDDWLGRDGARKEETPEAEERRAKDILDATGLTEAELDARPVKLSERLVLERTLRIMLAPGFVAGPLPPSRTLNFGAARWNETFTASKDSVEVKYRFDSGGVDFAGPALAEFRQAFWKWDKESWARVSLLLEADALFEQSKPVEAMAAWRAQLAANPKKGVLRARYAQALSNLGFEELARPELERALKDAPKHPLVLMIEGDIRRRGANGIIHGKGFDRAGAIKAMRAATAELPRHSWPRFRLAELLERDAEGEVVWSKNADLLEAIKLYEQLADEGLSDALTPLYDAQLRLGRFRDIIARKQKERQSLEADVYGRVASFMVDGPELCVQYLRGIEDPQSRASEAAALMGVLSLQRDPSKLDAAAAAFEPTMPGGAGAILKSIFSGIRPSPVSKDVSSPEAAMRSLLSQLAEAPSTPQKLKVAKAAGSKALSDEVDRLGLQALSPFASGALAIDATLTRGKCTADTVANTASRVTCTVQLGKPLVTSAWFVKDGATWRLESLGALSTLAERALKAANAKDGEQATKWLNWTSERIDQLGVPQRLPELRLFRSFWPPQSSPTPAELTFAASQARLFGPVDEATAVELAKAFEAARPALTGAKRRLTDQVLSSVYLRAQQPKKAVEILKPLAESEGEDALFQQLAGAMMRAGMLKEARALTQKALERTPTDSTWASLSASVSEREGKYAEARATYEAVYARTNDEDLVNNLLWARYMTGLNDEESEKMANTLSAKKTATPSELHTAAVVLVGRGKVPAAAQLSQRIALRAPPGTPDDARLQLKAELLATLGFAAEAKATWNQLALKDPLSDMARLKEKGLKALDAKPGR